MKELKSIMISVCLLIITVSFLYTINCIKTYYELNSEYQKLVKYPWVISAIERNLFLLECGQSKRIGPEYLRPLISNELISDVLISSESVKVIMYDVDHRWYVHDFERDALSDIDTDDAYMNILTLIDYFNYYGNLAAPQEDCANIVNLYQLQLNFFRKYYKEDLNNIQYLDFLKFYYLDEKFYEIALETTKKEVLSRSYVSIPLTSRNEFQTYIRRFNEFLALEENKQILEDLSKRYAGGD